MKKVAVLLSAYNGYDYIEEQIKSIYEQTYKKIEIYVRDDGSDEAFLKQLRLLRDEYSFTLIEGGNLGFVGSFMELLNIVNDADLYSFADQDDIWLPEKLERAVTWFDMNEKESVPLLFHSAYDVVDADTGKKKSKFYFSENGYDFRRSITENHYSGFSMVINKTLRNMMLKGTPSKIGYHDWWAAMIVKAFGTACSDEIVMSYHRSHGDNLTTFNINTRLKWLIETLNGESEIHMRCVEFDRCFGKYLSNKDFKMLDLFLQKGYHIRYALKKGLYPKRWRPVWSSELVIRFLMLVGRI